MEPLIKDPEICCKYVSRILRKRWPQAENLILGSEYAGIYIYHISNSKKTYKELKTKMKEEFNKEIEFWEFENWII